MSSEEIPTSYNTHGNGEADDEDNEEFVDHEQTVDDETTMEEEEALPQEMSAQEEINLLQEENNMSKLCKVNVKGRYEQ